MKLKKLLHDLDYVSIKNSNGEIDIKGIACDSRLIRENHLFVAIKGSRDDGHNFIKSAIEKKAKAIVIAKGYKITGSPLENAAAGSALIRVADTRKALTELFACFYQYPSRQVKTVGITGTNGKTTVSYLLHKILTTAGVNAGLIGTIGYKIGNRRVRGDHTTPPPQTLYPLLKKMVNRRVECAVLEVSSHSLDQHRTQGIDFNVGIFTNLSGDHLDYHRTKRNYFQSKAKMFKNLDPRSFAVINNDDHYASNLKKVTRAKVISYGLSEGAQIKAGNISWGEKGLSFSCLFSGEALGKVLNRKQFREKLDIESPLLGRHNLYNILAAIAAALCLNVSLKKIKQGVKSLASLEGRLEAVDCGQPFKVFIDYAHTDDALRAVLQALREFASRKIYLVFGCGGERDCAKRARMGRVANRLSDFTILTNDNPRRETPEKIIADIRKGIAGKNYAVILDRRKAIKKALLFAKPGDIVLIAGKGHEHSQILKNSSIPFNDREVTRRILNETF